MTQNTVKSRPQHGVGKICNLTTGVNKGIKNVGWANANNGKCKRIWKDYPANTKYVQPDTKARSELGTNANNGGRKQIWTGCPANTKWRLVGHLNAERARDKRARLRTTQVRLHRRGIKVWWEKADSVNFQSLQRDLKSVAQNSLKKGTNYILNGLYW